VEKFCTAGQTKDHNMAHCMLDTILLFRNDNGYVDGPQFYFIRTLPILFNPYPAKLGI
jgi:hypothetical protein